MPLLAPGELGEAGYPSGTTLGPWPIDLGDVLLDRVDDYGGLWNVTAFTGWGSPPSAIETTQLVAGHGAWIGGRWWAAKPYTIDISFEGETPAERWAAEQRLLGAVGLTDTTLTVHEEVERQTSVILNGDLVIDHPGNVYQFTAQVPLLAADPFRYALEPYTDTTGLPQTSGGLEWPATWPATWDAVVTSGVLVVTNAGSTTSWPVFKVYGPLPDFSLSNQATGETLLVDLGADGDALVAGEWLEIDMRLQRVMLLGQSPRRRAVSGTFFGLPPGESSVLLGSSVSNTTAFATVEGRSTWI